jgi:hypothetical protein
MPMSTIYRIHTDSDREHAARVAGIHAGYSHANYAENVNPNTPDTTMPEEFADVADSWQSGYEEGKDDYAASQEEEEMYGHDWRG